MLDNDRGYVALFIDWDNLAISIAADLGGATPDLKRIVQKAQDFGTILVARAYAEWQMTSDRLSVYRAGVEPVYAPTFRFEPDPVGQPPRGKSLADPCLVADCVDCLHLFPQLTTYVMVSGDKDLIPVVRLAQLRGKQVIVIGPDYAAGVLREMADQFISYRQLIEDVEPQPAAAEVARRGPSRPTRRHLPTREAAGGGGRGSRPSPAREHATPVATEPPPVITPVEPAAEPELREAPVPQPAAAAEVPKREPTEDIREVYRTMVEVLAERSQDGRARLRATNLKDILMQRIPGFNERRYGFTKFKDLLTAARKAGVVEVTQAGPVHWVSLPEPTTAPAEAAAAPSAEAQPAIAPTQAPSPAVEAAEAAQVEVSPEQAMEYTRFIHELGQRSRWLTYTYVLTNLISHLGRTLMPAAADAAARSILNYLVHENVLRVDREPREVEVGGIRHRVRMCHLEEAHPWVQQILAQEEHPEPEAPSAPAKEPAVVSAEGPTSSYQQEEERPVEAPAVEPGAEAEVAAPEKYQPGPEPSEQAEADQGAEEDRAAIAEETGEHNGHDRNLVIGGPATSAIAENGPQAAVEEGQTESESTAAEPGAIEPPALDEAFAALGDILRASITAERPRVRAAGLKAKLGKALGRFNERDYGFMRFKDFLTAAEREGWVQTQLRGGNTWVALGGRLQEEAQAE